MARPSSFKGYPMIQISLFDLINETHQATQQRRQQDEHRRLQSELPDELKGWELFFQRLGGRNTYFCINFDHKIITARHRTSHDAINEAYDYAIIYELLPVATLERVHPQRWLPARYRRLISENERRTGHVQTHPRPDQPIHA